MIEENKNTGVIEVAPKITDWIAGEETGIKYEVREGIDSPVFLPTKENQYIGKFDTLACVSFSANNSLEVQLQYLLYKNLTENLISQEDVDWLRDNGYFDDKGKINLSDRFLAKMSGTTRNGNSLNEVALTLSKVGAIPQKDWDFDCNTWEEFYKEIPQALKDKGLEFLKRFKIQYEWVIVKGWSQDIVGTLKYHTKQAPIQIAAPVCPMWSRFTLKETDTVKSCPSEQPQHATIIYRVDDLLRDFDHYDPHVKQLALDYPIPYGVKILLTVREKEVTVPPFTHKFSKTLYYGQHNSETVFLQKFLISQRFLKLDNPTDYFGELTRRAVKAFQVFHKVASPAELDAVNGRIVGPKTIAKINSLT